MRCAVWIGDRAFRIEEQPVPDTGPGQVRVRVTACGVCLTDVHNVDGHFGPTSPPRVLGHEYGGVIEAIGPDVRGLDVGTAVACWGTAGFSQHVLISAERVFPLPDQVPPELAIFVEPLACCLTAVQNAQLRPGCSVLITGAGPMGLMVLQLVRQHGATQILVSEPNPQRRALARQLGADDVIDPADASVSERAKSLTGGSGVDAAFEAAGHPTPLTDCLSALADGGTAVMVGVPPASASLDLTLYRFHRRNLTLRGSYGASGADAFRSAANRLSQLELELLVSHRFGLGEIATAFDVARTGAGLKVLVETNR